MMPTGTTVGIRTFQPEQWRDLYVMLGTTADALIGLLFVAMSMHLDLMVGNPIFRLRARNNTLHLLIMLVQAGLLLAPQPMLVIGTELAAVNLIGLHLPLTFAYTYFVTRKAIRRTFPIYPFVTYTSCYCAGLIGAIALIMRAGWGMYLISASYMTVLVAVALNGWIILLGLGLAETAAKAETGRLPSSGKAP